MAFRLWLFTENRVRIWEQISIKTKKPLFLFLVPAFAFMAIFLYYPFIQNILNSFKQITELGAASKGWNDPWYTNYVTMFQDEKCV